MAPAAVFEGVHSTPSRQPHRQAFDLVPGPRHDREGITTDCLRQNSPLPLSAAYVNPRGQPHLLQPVNPLKRPHLDTAASRYSNLLCYHLMLSRSILIALAVPYLAIRRGGLTDFTISSASSSTAAHVVSGQEVVVDPTIASLVNATSNNQVMFTVCVHDHMANYLISDFSAGDEGCYILTRTSIVCVHIS